MNKLKKKKKKKNKISINMSTIALRSIKRRALNQNWKKKCLSLDEALVMFLAERQNLVFQETKECKNPNIFLSSLICIRNNEKIFQKTEIR